MFLFSFIQKIYGISIKYEIDVFVINTAAQKINMVDCTYYRETHTYIYFICITCITRGTKIMVIYIE